MFETDLRRVSQGRRFLVQDAARDVSPVDEWLAGQAAGSGAGSRSGQRSRSRSAATRSNGARPWPRRWKSTASRSTSSTRADRGHRVGVSTTEAKTPEEYWRLTQEFWRKSIDSYKTAFQAQSKYVQSLAKMWMDMMTKGKA